MLFDSLMQSSALLVWHALYFCILVTCVLLNIDLAHLLWANNLSICSLAIKAEPLDDYQLNSYGYSDNQSPTSMSMKSLYHQLEQDSYLQDLNVFPALYHRTIVDPRVQVLTPDALDDYCQSRAGTLISSPMLYPAANQHYNNCLFGGSSIASHPASTPSHSVSTAGPLVKLVEGPQDPCLMSRHENFVQKMLPLGKSPPSRYIHAQAQRKPSSQVAPGGQQVTQNSSCRGNQEDRTLEKVTVKQESLHYAYLEDGEYYSYCIHMKQTNPSLS